MKGLPLWISGIVLVLGVLLIVYGYHDRHEAGWLPVILGAVLGLIALASFGAKAREVL